MFYGLVILSWYENLPKDEQPPRHIWWSDELVAAWFDRVEDNRTRGAPNKEEGPMEQNELIDKNLLRPK